MATQLKRTINLPVLTLYGLGNILGAGIYVLVGKVAGQAGSGSTVAFLVAMTIAALTAFSYMELSARFPVSASVSVYLQKAFGKKWLSLFAGFAMIAGGITSAAALSQGFAGYLNELINVPTVVASIGLLLAIGLLTIKGIGESAYSAAVLTLIEIVGLALVVWAGRSVFGSLETDKVFSVDQHFGISGVIAGAFLAFYAFIGFEDMVNVGEEVKNPKRNMPIAIFISLIASTAIYLLIVIVSLGSVPIHELAASDAPLTYVYSQNNGPLPQILNIVGMTAAANGIVVQMIMGSRFLYGLAKQGWLHSSLGKVHNDTKTPISASIVIIGLTILATIVLPLVSLAQLTSFLILIIFGLVNGSLIAIKRKHPKKNQGHATVPMIIPITGILSCVFLVIYQLHLWA